jgi:hypothetical protein
MGTSYKQAEKEGKGADVWRDRPSRMSSELRVRVATRINK